jgi:hypothetical protein
VLVLTNSIANGDVHSSERHNMRANVCDKINNKDMVGAQHDRSSGQFEDCGTRPQYVSDSLDPEWNEQPQELNAPSEKIGENYGQLVNEALDQLARWTGIGKTTENKKLPPPPGMFAKGPRMPVPPLALRVRDWRSWRPTSETPWYPSPVSPQVPVDSHAPDPFPFRHDVGETFDYNIYSQYARTLVEQFGDIGTNLKPYKTRQSSDSSQSNPADLGPLQDVHTATSEAPFSSPQMYHTHNQQQGFEWNHGTYNHNFQHENVNIESTLHGVQPTHGDSGENLDNAWRDHQSYEIYQNMPNTPPSFEE